MRTNEKNLANSSKNRLKNLTNSAMEKEEELRQQAENESKFDEISLRKANQKN